MTLMRKLYRRESLVEYGLNHAAGWLERWSFCNFRRQLSLSWVCSRITEMSIE